MSTAETVDELLNLFNGAELGLLAEINAAGNGINVRSRLSGADFTIGENGGTTATQLGIRTYTGATELADFNRGVGVPTTADLETLDLSQFDQPDRSRPAMERTLNINVSDRDIAAGRRRSDQRSAEFHGHNRRHCQLECQRQWHRTGGYEHQFDR